MNFLIIPLELGFSMSFLGNPEVLRFFSLFVFLSKFLWDCARLSDEKTAVFHDFVAISYIFSRILSRTSAFSTIFSIIYLFRWPALQKNLKFLILSAKFREFSCFFAEILLKLLVIAHFLACFWHFSAKNWLKTQQIADFSWETRYLECFFLIFGTFLFQGASKNSENSMNSCEKLVFLLIFCAALYFFARFLRKLLRRSAQNSEKLAHFYEIFEASGPFLLEKMRKSLKTRSLQRNKQQILDIFCEQAPKDLKDTVLLRNRERFLDCLKFLQCFSRKTLRALAVTMKNLHFDTGDAVNLADSRRNSEFFLVLSGKLQISQGFASKTFAKGASFNEIALFCDNFSSYAGFSLKVLQPSSVLVLSRARFVEILKESPEDYEKYCMFREKISLYKEAETIEKLGLSCEICEKNSHLLREDCEMLSFCVNRGLIIKKFSNFDPQNQRVAWKRRKVAKLSRNSLLLSRILQKNAGKLESLCARDMRNTVEDDSFGDSSHSFPENDDKIEENLNFYQKNVRETMKNEWQKFFEKAQDYTVFFPHNNPEKVLEKLNSLRKKIQKNYFFDENQSNLLSFSPKWTAGKIQFKEREKEKSLVKEGDCKAKQKEKNFNFVWKKYFKFFRK